MRTPWHDFFLVLTGACAALLALTFAVLLTEGPLRPHRMPARLADCICSEVRP